MRAGLEALAAVVMAPAARPDAAQRHVVLCDVENTVIDRDAAGDRAVDEALLDGLEVACTAQAMPFYDRDKSIRAANG